VRMVSDRHGGTGVDIGDRRGEYASRGVLCVNDGEWWAPSSGAICHHRVRSTVGRHDVIVRPTSADMRSRRIPTPAGQCRPRPAEGCGGGPM
jgi:hypothetical protein